VTYSGSACPRAWATNSTANDTGLLCKSNALLPRSVVLIAPTSTSARPASFRPEIEVEGSTTKVLVEQMGAVDINRLGELAGHLTSEEQWGVDEAILTVLGLN
jgi:mRNA interferase MazF